MSHCGCSRKSNPRPDSSTRGHGRTFRTSTRADCGHLSIRGTRTLHISEHGKILADDDKVLLLYNGKYLNTTPTAIMLCRIDVADIPIEELSRRLGQIFWKDYNATESGCTT